MNGPLVRAPSSEPEPVVDGDFPDSETNQSKSNNGIG